MKILKYIGIFVLFMVVAIAGAVFFAPKNCEYSTVTEINAPLSTSWEVFMDKSQMPLWIEGLTSIEHIGGESDAPGSEYRLVFDRDGQKTEMIETLKEVEEERLFSFKGTMKDMMEMDTRVEFESAGDDKTIMKTSTNIEALAMGMRLFFYSNSTMKKQGEKGYNKLKEIIEQHHTSHH